MLSPLDDYPVHQIPEPIRHVGTSDRNFYDRYYFNIHCCGDEVFATAGLGQYPNLGVADAFLAVTYAGHQHVLRASCELGDDRMDTTVGPVSIDVLEGLRRLRLRVDGDELAADLEWDGAIAAFLEPRHVNRREARISTDSARFAQTGHWSGTLSVAGETFEVEPGRWWGGRDRSWGIRPVGEPEPPGRPRTAGPGGFLWIYSTMQFAGSTVVTIVQEDRLGRRSLEEAVRIPALGRDGEPEWLGRPEHELRFVEGTREVESATLSFCRPRQPDLVVEVTPLTASWLALGTGYGMETDWRHGMYQGPLEVQTRHYDLSEPDIRKRRYGLVDNLARFEVGGDVGYGLFEVAVLGPNERYGFRTRS